MKIRIAIEQEYDLDNDNIFTDDDPFYEDNEYSNEDKIDLLLSRFVEDIDYLVKYDEVSQAVTWDNIEE